MEFLCFSIEIFERSNIEIKINWANRQSTMKGNLSGLNRLTYLFSLSDTKRFVSGRLNRWRNYPVRVGPVNKWNKFGSTVTKMNN